MLRDWGVWLRNLRDDLMTRHFKALSVLVFCASTVQAIDQPPSCPQINVSFRKHKITPDLNGALPVPDYLDTLVDCVGLAAAPRSEWLEDDAKRYAAVIARSKAAWLVLPAQTQSYGFDRIERALIGAEVADAFAGQAKIPDPMLVSRAGRASAAQ